MATRRRVDLTTITAGAQRTLPLASIRRDEATQPREEVSDQIIGEYAEAMTAREDGVVVNPAGQAWPALTVFEAPTEAGTYWLADGYHRLAAAERKGLTQIQVDVREGDLRAAILYAAGANREHGLRRTSADARRAIRRVLSDEEWRTRSNEWVAQTVGVSAPTVAKVRATLEQEGALAPATRRVGLDGREQYTKLQGRRPEPSEPPPSVADAPRAAGPAARPTTATWREIAALRGADYAVVVAHWETAEQLRLAAEYGLELLGEDGCLVLALPQGDPLGQFVAALELKKRSLQARGPVVVVTGSFTALLVYARGERSIPPKVTSLGGLVGALAGARPVLHITTEGGAATL